VVVVITILLILFLSDSSIDEGIDEIQMEGRDPYIDGVQREIVSEIYGYLEKGDRFQVDTSLNEIELLFPDDPLLEPIKNNVKPIADFNGDVDKFNYLDITDCYAKAQDAEIDGRHDDALVLYKVIYGAVSGIGELEYLENAINSSLKRVKGIARSKAYARLLEIRDKIDALSVLDVESQLKLLKGILIGISSIQDGHFSDARYASLKNEIEGKIQTISNKMLRTAISEEYLFGCNKAIPLYTQITDTFVKVNIPAAVSAEKYISRCRSR